MLHMHFLAPDLLAFVPAVLCLAFGIRAHLFADRATRFLVLVVGKAIDAEYAAVAGGLRGKGVKTTFADAKTMNMGQSSAFQSKAEAAIRSSLATNDLNCFSVTNEMTDRGLVDWRRRKAISASCLHYAT